MKRRAAFVGILLASGCGSVAAQPLPSLPQVRATLPPVPPPRAPRPAPVIEAPRNLPSGAPRSQGPLSLVVLVENAADPTESGVRRIVFREEATSRDYFARYDGGSMTATLRVRCAAGEFQLQSLRLYSRNNLAGDLLADLDQPSDWRTAASDPAMQRAMALACARAPTAAPTRTAAPAEAAAPALRGPIGAPPAARPRATVWEGAAQVGATGSEAGSRDELARLRRAEPALLRGLSMAVSPATVDGRTVWRLLVTGFADRTAASRFCVALSSKGRGCFLRESVVP